MNDAAETAFIVVFQEEWRRAVDAWSTRPSIVLLDEAYRVLTRAVCRWTGLPTDGRSAERFAGALKAMIENAGGVGPSMLLALWRRRRVEHEVQQVVRSIREGRADVPADAPASTIAMHRDQRGNLLCAEVATVEIINVMRSVAAIARYIMFAAMALHEHGGVRTALERAPADCYEEFAEEVRRLYPFFPVIGGKAKEAFTWQDLDFVPGDWVLLDLHGTNHDPRRFAEPDCLVLDRGISWRQQGFDFVPQGGGVARNSHRCPGEQLTVAVIERRRGCSWRRRATMCRSRICPSRSAGCRLSRPVGWSSPISRSARRRPSSRAKRRGTSSARGRQ